MTEDDDKRSQTNRKRIKAKLFEDVWMDSARQELERRMKEWRRVRSGQQTRLRWQADDEINWLYTTATLYDGLGNAQAAIDEYEKFLEAYGEDDDVRTFAQSRLDELRGQVSDDDTTDAS